MVGMMQAQENKGMLLVGVFMLNAVASSLSATGAFEIYLDGTLPPPPTRTQGHAGC